MSTQSYLLNDALAQQKQAIEAVRTAEKNLRNTPRSENLAATRALNAAQQALVRANALVLRRKADFDRANMR